MRSPVADLLGDLAATLEELDVPWYLFGARAAILHGAARLTADVDITVRLPGQLSAAALVQALERGGFRSRGATAGFVERTRVIPVVHTPSSLPVDIVLAGPGLEDQFFERVVVRHVDQVRIPVASAEDIAIMKVLAGRPKDLEDVVAVAASHDDSFDVAYIRRTLAQVEEALGQSDLIPAFEDALARSRRRGRE